MKPIGAQNEPHWACCKAAKFNDIGQTQGREYMVSIHNGMAFA
jgi:hypothetical protein